ncbi:DUF1565 domain-containing protein [Oxynema aestuarii]|uniref:DUF1565 domain-containing protein n=1 Tax=Oxynema aestuarii AP17 TaxID=2064643 RepID=A0A6H1TTR5_9CYAN|nr:DUF1565 domain-containing protein [Oxynema aestuarii]QIZ69941.1 DUF1565 domain-containing protein [Oxynema aestuarii AP17]
MYSTSTPQQPRHSQSAFAKRLHGRIATLVVLSAALASSLYTPATLAEPSAPSLAQNDRIKQNTEAQRIFVSATDGNDSTGNGSESQPFKTITRALRVAKTNSAIVLAPGTYSAETGESFPLMLKPGMTLQGNPDNRGRGIVIRGGGDFLSPSFARQDATILAGDGSTLTGVTVTNPNRRGYGVWIESTAPTVTRNTFTESTHDGISVVGDGRGKIEDNHFIRNGANGITIYGSARPEIRDNLFERTGFGINVAQKSAPILIGNRLVWNRDGILVQGEARPILRNNELERNQQSGVVTISNALPDLGTAEEPGGNVFRNNGQYDINAEASKQIIPAFGNQLASDRTVGRLDLRGVVDPNPQTVASNPQRRLPPLNRGSANTVKPATRPFPSPTTTNTPAPEPEPTREIPVPRPGAPIEIPVPPPDGRSPSVSRGESPAPTGQSASTSNPRIGNQPGDTLPVLLPVPDPNAPLGNGGGGVPQVVVSQNPQGSGSPPPPPDRAAALGLRYRVIVNTTSDRDHARIRRIVPDAFRTRINGRLVMQVGAFATQDKVDEMLSLLKKNGFTGTVLPID